MEPKRPLILLVFAAQWSSVAACRGGEAPPKGPIEGAPSAKPFSFPPATKIVNPQDPVTHVAILVDKKGTCHVDSTDPNPNAIPCPPELTDPAYAEKCPDRLIVQRGPNQCQCEVFAHPPYMGVVPCPKP